MATRKKRITVAQQRRAIKQARPLKKAFKNLNLHIRKHQKLLPALGWVGPPPFPPTFPPFRSGRSKARRGHRGR